MANPYETKQPVRLWDPSGRLSLAGLKDNILNFPYTPTVSSMQGANYSEYALTHNNFQQRSFESGQNVEINITAPMVVRNEEQAEYIVKAGLWVRSAMKMNFGQDSSPGLPPPVLRLYAHGLYTAVPCMIRDFAWNLDSDIDYLEYKSESTGGIVRIPVMNTFVLSLSTTYAPKDVRENFSVKDYMQGKLRNDGYV